MKLINRKAVLNVPPFWSVMPLKYRLPVVYDHLQALTRTGQKLLFPTPGTFKDRLLDSYRHSL